MYITYLVKLIAKPNNVNILLKTNTDTWSPLSYALSRNSNLEIIKKYY